MTDSTDPPEPELNEYKGEGTLMYEARSLSVYEKVYVTGEAESVEARILKTKVSVEFTRVLVTY